MVDRRGKSSRYFSHREHVVSHEEGSWADARPHAPLTQRSASRHTISLDKDNRSVSTAKTVLRYIQLKDDIVLGGIRILVHY